MAALMWLHCKVGNVHVMFLFEADFNNDKVTTQQTLNFIAYFS